MQRILKTSDEVVQRIGYQEWNVVRQGLQPIQQSSRRACGMQDGGPSDYGKHSQHNRSYETPSVTSTVLCRRCLVFLGRLWVQGRLHATAFRPSARVANRTPGKTNLRVKCQTLGKADLLVPLTAWAVQAWAIFLLVRTVEAQSRRHGRG